MPRSCLFLPLSSLYYIPFFACRHLSVEAQDLISSLLKKVRAIIQWIRSCVCDMFLSAESFSEIDALSDIQSSLHEPATPTNYSACLPGFPGQRTCHHDLHLLPSHPALLTPHRRHQRPTESNNQTSRTPCLTPSLHTHHFLTPSLRPLNSQTEPQCRLYSPRSHAHQLLAAASHPLFSSLSTAL